MWSETRTVTKTATVSMHANTYEVDAALVGRKVELVFDPFDLAVIEVRWNNRPMGVAVPVRIGRHAHPAARPEQPAPPAAGTGIDYLALVEARRDRADDARISYSGIGPARIEVGPRPNARRPQPAGPALRLGTHRAQPPPQRPPRQQRQRGRHPMSIERLRSHWGFTRTPFTKDLAPSMLHRHPGHAEAVARIAWCVDEAAIGSVTGEVGSGKTVAVRAALADLDTSRHTVIYFGNPAIGARGLYTSIVTHLGGIPRFHRCALIPQAADALAAEVTERGKRVVDRLRRSPPH